MAPGIFNSLFRRRRLDREMDEELCEHIELRAADLEAAGVPREEARRRARIEFGALESYKEECRETRGLRLVHDFYADLRYGFRMLGRSPSFTAVAVLTLALGIGANTAMFSALDAVLLRAFPYRKPNQLVAVWERNPKVAGFLGERMPVRLQSYLRWKQEAKSFQDLAIYTSNGVNLAGIQTPKRVESGQASANFFPMLGVGPALGRLFFPGDGDPGRNHIAVISHALFASQFGGDPKVLGRTITLDQVPYRVVGVLPASFYLPAMWGGFDQTKAEVWTPLDTRSNQSLEALMSPMYFVYGRLKVGVTPAQANSELSVIERQLQHEFPEMTDYKQMGVGVFTLKEEDVGDDQRRSLMVLQFAVGFVLLIACANVANLLLARAAGRERELAIRRALGASRGRLVRQMLVESLLVTALGGASGLLLAWWCVDWLRSASLAPMYALKAMRLDPAVLAFSALAMMIAGMLFGLAPAFHAAGRNVQRAIGKGGRSAAGGVSARFRSGLVVAEIALALVPLAGAGLMVRTLRALLHQDLGFRPEHVLVARVSLPQQQYGNHAQQVAFNTQLLERVRGIPGVKAAAIADGLPMQSVDYTTYRWPDSTQERTADFQNVSDGYFAAMGATLLRGRAFTAADAAAATPSVAIANQAFVRRDWPGGDPIGKTIIRADSSKKGTPLTIIGVAPDTHQVKLTGDVLPQVFVPTHATDSVWLVVRGSGDPASLLPSVTATVHAIDKSLPLYDAHPFAEVVRENVSDQRFTMLLLVAFAGLALLLSAIGVYGVLNYAVQQRTPEIGVRMALGALPRDVLAMIMREGAVLAIAGAALGIAGALLLTHLMTRLLFGVKPYDALTLSAAAALILAVALLSSYLPAQRAAKVDPNVALRYD